MKTVLVIESNEATRNALHDLLLLEWPNLTVLTAKDGSKGLILAKQIKMDLVIFEGTCVTCNKLNSNGLAQQLRQIPNLRTTPLIAVTIPNIHNHKIATDLADYCNAWLLKPFSAERLIRVVSPFAYTYR